MNVEDRLRRAIEARTDSIEPSPDALRRINDKLPYRRDPVDFSSTRTRFIVAAAAAVVLVGALLAGLLLPGGDDGSTRTGDTDTTERPTTTDRPDRSTTTTTDATQPSSTTATTSAPASPTSTTSVPQTAPTMPGQNDMLWPRPSSDVRFDTPEAAARSFALYYAGFRDPIVGAFRQGDSRSGEVPVQAFAGGAETTVLVRQLDGSDWFVTAALSENINLANPPAGAGLGLRCPQHVDGTALAFEGTVQVRIDAYQFDGDRVELGSGFVTGSGSPPAGPFEGDIACRFPDATEHEQLEAYGILTLWEPSAEDGSTMAITAIPLTVLAG